MILEVLLLLLFSAKLNVSWGTPNIAQEMAFRRVDFPLPLLPVIMTIPLAGIFNLALAMPLKLEISIVRKDILRQESTEMKIK